jgi:hypothetical protein
LSLLGISVWGLYPILKLLQWQARENIEHLLQQQLPDDQLEAFENPTSLHSFAWEEKGKEFHYNGSMYDVVRTVQKKGKTLYYCINDKKESKVYNCMEELVGKQLDNNSTTTGAANHYLIKLLVQVFVLSGRHSFAVARFSAQRHYSYYHSFQYPSSVIEIISPPPEII